jgi:phytoene dehydrogenase-like protein
MGQVATLLAEKAKRDGAEIRVNAGVKSLLFDESGKTARGVVLHDGSEVHARVVVSNADPFRMRTFVGAGNLPTQYNKRLDAMMKNGSTFKLNMALSALPTFSCLKEDRGQFNTTIHLLPDEKVSARARVCVCVYIHCYTTNSSHLGCYAVIARIISNGSEWATAKVSEHRVVHSHHH